MAIIALGRLDKKLLLNVFLFIVQTANLIIRYSVYNLYEKYLIILEEEISSIIVGILLHFIFIKKKQSKIQQEQVKRALNILLFYLS